MIPNKVTRHTIGLLAALLLCCWHSATALALTDDYTRQQSEQWQPTREELAKADAEAKSLSSVVRGRADSLDRLTLQSPVRGVVKSLQNSRMASTLAFMMIEYIRRDAVAHYGASRGEIGWVLDDNQGMNAIASAIDSQVNKVYTIYEKQL